MKKLLIVLIILLISISGCVTSIPPVVECTRNDECTTGGCSGQLCGKKGEVENIITTCEWRNEYDCLRLTQCQCIENKCQWNQTPEYQQCLVNITP